MRVLRCLVVLAIPFLGPPLTYVSAEQAKLDFNRDIRPILSENCFSCHGFDEKGRQADLRLDQSESAYANRSGSIAIIPGKPDASELWRRITADDPDVIMPPPTSHLVLTDHQKQLLRAWIEQGAEYAGHWAFIPPKKIAPPSDNPTLLAIDAFVSKRMSAEYGWSLSKPADKSTLIRRLSLDLIGMPPSGDEVRMFLQDDSPKAYEALVDRLLASPHFGERLALEWLDAARYADTNGFSIDGGRHMWLWRDWVIQSFNDNLPYDQFLKQQLAGDLIPDADVATRIATGFQRNNMVTHEGGTIPEENLTNYNADRVKTFGEAMLGLTLACAQCHDHKFDPISQHEYYQLFAYFNTLSDAGLDGNSGVNPAPSIKAQTVLRTNELESLQTRIDQLELLLSTPNPSVLSDWEAVESAKLANRGKNLKLHPVKALKVSTPNRGAGFEIEEGRLIRLREPGGMGAFDISIELPPLDEPITGIRMTALPVAELPGGGWGLGPNLKRRDPKTPVPNDEPKGTFSLTAIGATADVLPNDQVNLFKLLPIESVTANTWDPAHPPAGCLDLRNDDGWSPDLSFDGPVRLTANLAVPIQSKLTPFLTVQLNFGKGQSLIPELVEIHVLTGYDDDSYLPKSIIEILTNSPQARTAEQAKQIWDYCASYCEQLKRERIELANLKDRVSVLTDTFSTMVMDVAAEPRETFVLTRGDYSKPTEKVTPGTPAVITKSKVTQTQNRLALADWLIQPDHPLTSRVAVNRFWKMIFGTGIVSTASDFGSQGEWPSHPELLDWLAVDFVESNWDIKRLIKQIVMSETYKQSSVATPELLEKDPQNRLLARAPRYRIAAEFVRDSALKISGLLVPRIGGPSVNPYTPSDLWREVSHYGSTPATAQTFVQDHGEKLYRRSLYTYWKRTAPPPNMLAFDAPNREVCTISRGTTTTPLQALVTLNDVQFVEAARQFAQRILLTKTTDHERLDWAFFETTSRLPSQAEKNILLRTLEREHNRFASDIRLARQTIEVGESEIESTLAPQDIAAWMQIATILLNLSETVTRS